MDGRNKLVLFTSTDNDSDNRRRIVSENPNLNYEI